MGRRIKKKMEKDNKEVGTEENVSETKPMSEENLIAMFVEGNEESTVKKKKKKKRKKRNKTKVKSNIADDISDEEILKVTLKSHSEEIINEDKKPAENFVVNSKKKNR